MLAPLAAEALRDALRRRLALVVAGVALLGVASAESCTAFGPGTWVVDGQSVDPELVAAWLAPLLFGFEILLFVVLAGLLAADHLARPLAEGSALLWLARPVGRGAYALARLAGALGVAYAAGAVLLGGTAVLLVGRHDLAAGPAVVGALAGALGAAGVAGLAMSASLWLGRVAVVTLVGTLVPLVALINTLRAAGARLDGFLGLLDRGAPPLGRAILAAVAPWNPHVSDLGAEAPRLLAVLAAWALAGGALLVLSFRRVELPR